MLVVLVVPPPGGWGCSFWENEAGVPLRGDCAPSGGVGGFFLSGKGMFPLPGGDFFLSGNGDAPPFLFLPAGEKETRISALRAALRAVALRNAAAAAGARCKEKEGLG